MTEYFHQPAARPTPPPSTPRNGRKNRTKESIRSVFSTLAILLIAPIVAVILTAFVFQSYQVDGPSMNTTLYNNDRLIVWKLGKTWARITNQKHIPKRGDVVVFTEPRLAEFGQDPGKQLIKRVIALPGERVVVKDRVVTVFNTEHPNGFQPDAELPYGKVITGTGNDTDVVVPAGRVFVLGDNRSNSLDSRMFGAVSADNIVGKLVVRVLPLRDFQAF